MDITFIDEPSNRRWTFDAVAEIKILPTQAVRVRCLDGFQTVVSQSEFTKIVMEKEDQ